MGITSCSKKEVPKDDLCTFPASGAWLQQKKAEYSSCVCITKFFTGIWNGKQVMEIRPADPLCYGISLVYNYETGAALISGDQDKYNLYASEVTGLKEIWTCSKQAGK